MVDIARQRAKWFFLLKVFVGVLLSCFQSVFKRELELLNSVDILYPTIRLYQSILKRRFPSVDKPLRIKPLKRGL